MMIKKEILVNNGVSKNEMRRQSRTQNIIQTIKLIVYTIIIVTGIVVTSLTQFPFNGFITNSLRLLIRDGIVANNGIINITQKVEIKQPIYVTYGDANNLDILMVQHILKKLGFRNQTAINNLDWDFLWASEYPFDKYIDLKQLKDYQRINYFPGIGVIRSKSSLATEEAEALILPENRDILEYSDKIFFQRNLYNRKSQLKNLDEINVESANSIEDYIDNPLLVDGHSFNVGIYVVMTSVDPLRIYIYRGDMIFKYCPVPYYPFDASKLQKYIIGDDYVSTWDMSSLYHYYSELGFGEKASFDLYMKSKGKETDVIWSEAEDAVGLFLLKLKPDILTALKDYNSKHNFFQIMRFDLLIDDNMKIWLQDVNINPFNSDIELYQYSIFYKKFMLHVFNLVGIGSKEENIVKNNIHQTKIIFDEITVHDK